MIEMLISSWHDCICMNGRLGQEEERSASSPLAATYEHERDFPWVLVQQGWPRYPTP